LRRADLRAGRVAFLPSFVAATRRFVALPLIFFFAAFARGGVPPADLPAAEAFVVLSVADGDLKVLQLDDGTVAECDETSSAPVTWPQARLARELADAGLLLSWQTADKTKASAGV